MSSKTNIIKFRNRNQPPDNYLNERKPNIKLSKFVKFTGETKFSKVNLLPIAHDNCHAPPTYVS